MKKIFISLLLIGATFAAHSQNVKQDAKGNYIAVRDISTANDTKTGKTYTDAKGNVYPVFKSKAGKLYVIRTSAKGNKYKYYLKIN